MERAGQGEKELGHVSIDPRARVTSGKSTDSLSIDTTSVSNFKIFITQKLSLLTFLSLCLFHLVLQQIQPSKLGGPCVATK